MNKESIILTLLFFKEQVFYLIFQNGNFDLNLMRKLNLEFENLIKFIRSC